MKTAKRNWRQEVGSVLAQVFADHPDEELTLGDVYDHAMGSGRIPAEYIEGVQEVALRREFGRILRASKLETADGRDVRRYQSYMVFVQTRDGKEVQRHLWKDIREMSPAEMTKSAKQRKGHIAGAEQSLQADLDFWNERVRARGQRRIQLSLL